MSKHKFGMFSFLLALLFAFVSVVGVGAAPKGEATVTLSLCGSKNQFGMVFRAAPGDNFYRFVVSCNGQTRLERSISGSRLPLLDWLSSGDAPIAAPAEVKIGVWAVGGEMRFFLNDHFQFSLSDPVFTSGTIGFFVFANGQTPVTVSFTGLSVFSVHYIPPTFTPAPSPTSTPNP